jgi:hypothetical protein
MIPTTITNFFCRVHGRDYEDHHKDLRSDKAGFT